MSYRNGTYVAFDGQGTTNPTLSDLRYYQLLRQWNSSSTIDFSFSDSHSKTYQVRDTSSKATLEQRLLERMRNSKNMLLILSEDTSCNQGMLPFEIEKAVDFYDLPIIIAYPGYTRIGPPKDLSERWPDALAKRMYAGSAKCIHVPFKKEPILAAIKQFSVHNSKDDALDSPYQYYVSSAYDDWGL